MSYRADKIGDGRPDGRADTRTDAGNDNTRRPKLASGNQMEANWCNIILIDSTVLFWSFLTKYIDHIYNKSTIRLCKNKNITQAM